MNSTTIKNVDEYLAQLNQELKGSDPALIQDALFDAEEHLRTALENVLANSPESKESESLPQLIEKYGTPSDIAAAYRDVEPHRGAFIQIRLGRILWDIGRFPGLGGILLYVDICIDRLYLCILEHVWDYLFPMHSGFYYRFAHNRIVSAVCARDSFVGRQDCGGAAGSANAAQTHVRE